MILSSRAPSFFAAIAFIRRHAVAATVWPEAATVTQTSEAGYSSGSERFFLFS